MAQKSALERALERLLSGPHRQGDNFGTDAPGTNSRVDVNSPDGPGRVAVTGSAGKGQPDSLGYHQHGDAPRLAQGKAAMETALKRFPDLAHHGRPGPAVPEYNRLYDGLRTDDAYDKVPYNTAHGTWVVGTTTSQVVTLDAPANLRLSQFPGAILAHPVLLSFALSQSVLTATGQYSIVWQPTGADWQVPLAEINAAKGDYENTVRWVIPMGISDPGVTTLGTFIITPVGVVGTPTILWRMTFGWAYDLPAPAFKGYIPLQAGIWQRAQQNDEN